MINGAQLASCLVRSIIVVTQRAHLVSIGAPVESFSIDSGSAHNVIAGARKRASIHGRGHNVLLIEYLVHVGDFLEVFVTITGA